MRFEVQDWGEVGYRPAWDRQLTVHARVMAGGTDQLVLVEHPPVLTLGANFHEENLLHEREVYVSRGIEIVKTDRGGDVTFHGPGQLVIYPLFDVSRHGKDLHKWMRDLEETMMLVCREFGLEPRRFAPHTGAWIGDRKVAAIGVKVRKWVSLHGIALNCNCDLSVFDTFVPCGIQDYGVTSLSEEMGRDVPVGDAKDAVIRAFETVFG